MAAGGQRLIGPEGPFDYTCCFCGRSIDAADTRSVQIALSAIHGEDPAVQALFAHIACLDEKFGSALAPEIWFDIEVFGPSDA